MTTAALVKKLNKEVADLRKDMAVVQRVLMAPPRDPEGEYRPSFIKKVLSREKESAMYRFTTRENFMRDLHAWKKRDRLRR